MISVPGLTSGPEPGVRHPMGPCDESQAALGAGGRTLEEHPPKAKELPGLQDVEEKARSCQQDNPPNQKA